jgi:hypothetical protein
MAAFAARRGTHAGQQRYERWLGGNYCGMDNDGTERKGVEDDDDDAVTELETDETEEADLVDEEIGGP